jgi:hypothetical protein
VNEEWWYHFLVEVIGFLCATDHCAERDIFVVKENIPDESGFSSTATADENADGIFWDLGHVELLHL